MNKIPFPDTTTPVPELAKRLGVSATQIYRWRKDGINPKSAFVCLLGVGEGGYRLKPKKCTELELKDTNKETPVEQDRPRKINIIVRRKEK